MGGPNQLWIHPVTKSSNTILIITIHQELYKRFVGLHMMFCK